MPVPRSGRAPARRPAGSPAVCPRRLAPSRGSGSSAAEVRCDRGRSARRTRGRPRPAPAPASPRSPRQPPFPVPTPRPPESHRSTAIEPGVRTSDGPRGGDVSTNGTRLTSIQAWVLALTSAASLMVSLDTQVVATALPVIRLQLHASLAELEWTVNAYTLTFAVLLLTRSEERRVGKEGRSRREADS